MPNAHIAPPIEEDFAEQPTRASLYPPMLSRSSAWQTLQSSIGSKAERGTDEAG
ncbi:MULTISPECIES: hypothetical protein [unclassified Microcoleus]|uniref:hypothetical protein n=1 Tax=unclassified Microcoleus TaxID=2642155 RepID=UPI002FD07D94